MIRPHGRDVHVYKRTRPGKDGVDLHFFQTVQDIRRTHEAVSIDFVEGGRVDLYTTRGREHVALWIEPERH
jgi:hypothetical protein